MGDVIIQIGEGAALVLAYLGASALIMAAVAIFFPVAAIVVFLCLCGPIGTPFAAICGSFGFAGASKDDVHHAEHQVEKANRDLERAEQKLAKREHELSLAQSELDQAEQVPDALLSRFQIWGRMKRTKQRFDQTGRQNRLDRAQVSLRNAKRDFRLFRMRRRREERNLERTIQSHKYRMASHWTFVIAILIVVLWVLYLLPPP